MVKKREAVVNLAVLTQMNSTVISISKWQPSRIESNNVIDKV